MTGPVTAPAIPPMVAREAEDWPSPFAWLDRDFDRLRFAILERARLDVVMRETSANRGPEIDRYLRRAHVPEEYIVAGKGYWCAAWAGCIWIDAGARVPRDFGNCDKWLPYLVPCTWADLPDVGIPGDAVLYGVPGNAVHIELLVRNRPKATTIGGNRGVGGSATNNGTAVHIDDVTRRDVLGVVRPIAAAA